MKVEAKDSSSASAGRETKCKISAADVPTYRLSSIAVAIDQQTYSRCQTNSSHRAAHGR